METLQRLTRGTTELIDGGTIQENEYSDTTFSRIKASAKSQLKELILQVIGEDDKLDAGFEHLSTDDFERPENAQKKYKVMKRASQNLLRSSQRQRLSALLGGRTEV